MSDARVTIITERDEVAAFLNAAGPFIYAAVLVGLFTLVVAWALSSIEDFKNDR